MITEKELTEYRSLCSSLDSLCREFSKRKKELARLLEETSAKRKEALLALARANRLTRHLTGNQRCTTGLHYRLSDIEARINQANLALYKNSIKDSGLDGVLPVQAITENSVSRRELKQVVLATIALIDNIKKHLLQLDLLEMRCRELILSINKALQAFRHEAAIIRAKIYPYGIFSLLRRRLALLFGSPYFSHRDMKEITALGNITGLVLKIADSPLI